MYRTVLTLGILVAAAAQPALACTIMPIELVQPLPGEPEAATTARQALKDQRDALQMEVSALESRLYDQRELWKTARSVVLVEVIETRPVAWVSTDMKKFYLYAADVPPYRPAEGVVVEPPDYADFSIRVSIKTISTLKGTAVKGLADFDSKREWSSCGPVMSPGWDVFDGAVGKRFVLFLSDAKVVQDAVRGSRSVTDIVDPDLLQALAAKVR